VDVLVDRGGPARKRRGMARMRHHLEFMADKECIYEGAVLPVCGRPVAVVTEIHPVPARDVVTYGPKLY
jgi:hypothetical protein